MTRATLVITFLVPDLTTEAGLIEELSELLEDTDITILSYRIISGTPSETQTETETQN